MKPFPILSASLLVLALALPAIAEEFAPQESPPEASPELLAPTETGRYQLFDGQYAVLGLKGGELPERHLMKIDTVTGQVWVGKQIQYLDRKGKVIQQRYWEPFEQYIEGPSPPPAPGR